MIDEKKLVKEIWKLFGEKYTNAFNFSEEETKLAERIIIDVQGLAENQSKIGEWVLCSERLPEEDKDVLIYTSYDGVDMAYISDENWRYTRGDEFINTVENANILAWQPLPEQYKE